MKRALLRGICVLAGLSSAPILADTANLELAKASAHRMAAGSCGVVRLMAKMSKMQSGTDEYEVMKRGLADEAKALNDLQARETELLRGAAAQLSAREVEELNAYSHTTLSKICATAN